MIEPKDEKNGDSGAQSGDNNGSQQSGEGEKKNGAALSVPSAGVDEGGGSKKATSATDGDDDDTSGTDGESGEGGEWAAVGGALALLVGFFWYTKDDSRSNNDPLAGL